jgi:hypothetical protein
MSSYTFYEWVKRFPILKRAKDVALEAIGCRREIGALKNKYNANVMMKQQYLYDKDWWKSEVKRAELHAKNQQRHNPDVNYTIVMEDFSKKESKTKEEIDDRKS